MYTVVAYQNKQSQTQLPATQTVDIPLAKAAAELMFAAGGEGTSQLLLDCGLVFKAERGLLAFSLTTFENMFKHIAYVIISPVPGVWSTMPGLMCSCAFVGLQQQCPHSLHAESLPLRPAEFRRDFSVGPSQRKTGRPKGTAIAKSKRVAPGVSPARSM